MSKPPVEVWVGVVKAITADGLVDVELDTGDVLEAVDPVGDGFTVGDAVVVIGHDYTAHALAARTRTGWAGAAAVPLAGTPTSSTTVSWGDVFGTTPASSLIITATVYGTSVPMVTWVTGRTSTQATINIARADGQNLASTGTMNAHVHVQKAG